MHIAVRKHTVVHLLALRWKEYYDVSGVGTSLFRSSTGVDPPVDRSESSASVFYHGRVIQSGPATDDHHRSYYIVCPWQPR